MPGSQTSIGGWVEPGERGLNERTNGLLGRTDKKANVSFRDSVGTDTVDYIRAVLSLYVCHLTICTMRFNVDHS